MKPLDDIIAAISTPMGEGGIAVIRVSGDGAIELVDACFLGENRLSMARSHTVHHGWIYDTLGHPVDEVLATVFRSPRSYTGDDTVEIGCHGGLLVAKKVLSAVIDARARQAEPGEFTKRAFLNGRIDLIQAEAVADLIHTQSESARRLLLSQIEGDLSRRMESVTAELRDLIGWIEVGLDFGEEGIQIAEEDVILGRIGHIKSTIGSFVESYGLGRLCKEGVRVAIVGLPNVGKSSLLNAILDQDRAIVAEIPGTTRDVIEGSISVNGVLLRFFDTAGLRETEDAVEIEGVRRSRDVIRKSDCCLYVVDISLPWDHFQSRMISEVQDLCKDAGSHFLLVINKTDLLVDKLSAVTGHFLEQAGTKTESAVRVSALKGEGVEVLLGDIVESSVSEEGTLLNSTVVLTSARQNGLCLSALSSLEEAENCIRQQGGHELVALHLREAADCLAEVGGRITTDSVLDSIFSKFCIGK